MQLLETHQVVSMAQDSRLSDYLVGVFDHLPSRKSVKKALKRGEIRVNDREETSAYWVKEGDRIQLFEGIVKKSVFQLKVPVVYEDDFLALVFKPGGLKTSGSAFRTLENALPFFLRPSTQSDAWRWPRPVHRLDAPTCGLLLIAKTATTGISLAAQFKEKKVKKEYVAVVVGQTPAAGMMDTPVDGKPAKTIFETVRVAPDPKSTFLSLVKVIPETGRTHQIRRHFQQLGNPVHGDKIYGFPDKIFRGKGLFLCATRLQFFHPATGDWMDFSVNYPPKFDNVLNKASRL